MIELSEKKQLIAEHKLTKLAYYADSAFSAFIIHYSDGERVLVSREFYDGGELYDHTTPYYLVKVDSKGSFRINRQRHNLSNYSRTNL